MEDPKREGVEAWKQNPWSKLPTWGKWTVVVLGAILLIGIGASLDTSEKETADTQSTEPSAVAETTEPEVAPEPTPEPDGKFSLNCDYLLSGGYRFVAGGDIENTGDIGIVVRVRAEWEVLGDEPVVATEKRRLQPGQSVNVQMTEQATSAQIDAHQSAEGGCDVEAEIVSTF